MATQTRLPTGDHTVDQWTASSGGGKYADVDDPIGSPDDDSTYISRTGSNGSQFLTFAPFAITSSAITRVSVYSRSRRTDGTAGSTNRVGLRINGVSYTPSSTAHTTSYDDYVTDWLTNPATAADWLEADVEGTGSNPIEAFGFVPANITGGREVRATSIHIEVEYTDAGGGAKPWLYRSHTVTLGAGFDSGGL